ncbi:MAG: hypothetical protein HZA54_07585, partial [Planctomycetes bacterium]|nr:hypothetical protein [Planctomycetota bacterium]
MTPEARAAFVQFGSQLSLLFFPGAAALLAGTVALRRIRISGGTLRWKALAAGSAVAGFLTLLGVASGILFSYAGLSGHPTAFRLAERVALLLVPPSVLPAAGSAG